MLKRLNQIGSTPILLLLAALGILIFLFITNTFSFKDRLFNKLFPKPPSHAAEQTPSVPDEILLKFKPGVPEKAKDNIRKAHGLEKIDEIAQIAVEKTKVPEKAKDKIIEALNKNPMVEYAQPNYINQATLNPDDTYFPRQWAPPKITAPSGWDISVGSPSAVIAVLDTGINVNHEDLIGKYIGSPAPDDNGHGTLVSGTAAASSNNGKGVAGICWLCQILSLKVLSSTGSGSNWTVDQGITTAADQGAKVINLSLGSYSGPQDMQDAVNYAWNKGVVVVAASGNDNTTSAFYPAAFNNVVAVGGSGSDDTKLNISNYGSWLDVVAPGVSIATTTMDGSYNVASGTSMASPHVAGLAGLIFSANPKLSNAQVVDIITSTADDLGDSGRDDYYGWGKINVGRALQKATGTTGPLPDTTSPQIKVLSPTDGSTISGVVTIKIDATDNVGVVKVQASHNYCGGNIIPSAVIGEDTTQPYEIVWDTTKVPNGTCNLSVSGWDAAGNHGTGQPYPVHVTISNGTTSDTQLPTVSITSPTDGSTVSGNVNVTTSAIDNISVQSISIFVDGQIVTSCSVSGTNTSCSYSWDSTKETNGSHTIYASALDSSQNLAQSSTITVNVNNQTSTPTSSPTSTPAPSSTPIPTPSDTTPPTVSITNPLDGDTVKVGSRINIQAQASDNVGVSKVEFYVNNSLKCLVISSPYICLWKVPGKKNVSYTIKAQAFDASSNTNTASVVVKTQ